MPEDATTVGAARLSAPTPRARSRAAGAPIVVGLIGAGVVGEGVLRLLRDNATTIAARLGGAIRVKRVVARQEDKARGDAVPVGTISFDPNDVLGDPEIEIVVEVMGGLDPAGSFVRRAIEAGKSVVTANKALLAAHGHELIELAEARGVDLYFEASVGGGIPIIRVLREALASDRIVAVRGIVNGTSNYILTRMRDERSSFADALRGAQVAGYAEADPTLDVGGGDAAHKLTILATLAWGAKIAPAQVETEGITRVASIDIEYAERFGYVIKPLAVARAHEGGALELRVHPALVDRRSVLASVSGALNAIHVEGAALGPCMLSGYGAGALPTAVSVVSDIVDVGRNLLADARGRVPTRAFRGEHLVAVPIRDPREQRCRWFLRFSPRDLPGVLARIAGILGAFDVPIAQLVQEEREGGSERPLSIVVLTHEARAGDVRDAIREVDGLASIAEPTYALRIEDG